MTVDAGFTSTVETRLTAAAGDQRATWTELTRRPGTALVGAALLVGAGGGPPVVANEGRGFQPFVLWVRDRRASQPAARLEVIGLVDGRGPFGGSVLVGAETIAIWPPAERASYFVALAEEANERDVASGIALAVPELRVRPLSQEGRLIQGVRGLLAAILQGFMGVGLLAGVAALGTISARAVVERRRQIGVLRALGFSARLIGLGLLAEAGLVTLLGTGLGVGIGLVVARDAVTALARLNPQLRFGVPWEQLGLIVLIALAASLAMTLLPARQAARLSPAAALRDA